MADPRASVDFVGIGYRAETFKIDNSTITYDATKSGGSTQVGLAVRLSAAATVELVGDGEDVVGKLVQVDKDKFAVVQTKGYLTLPGGSGAALTRGEKIVGDLGAASAEGYIRAVDTSTASELGHARGRIIDAGTTTAVVVDLG
jgi:hypothetical protein